MAGKESYEEDESKTAFCMCILAFSALLGACGLKAAAPETEAARVESGKQETAETAAGNSKTAGTPQQPEIL